MESADQRPRHGAEGLTPTERSLRARLAAHSLHAKVDSVQHTEPARRAFMARFEDEVDPERALSQAERSRRADQAKKAYFSRLALRSVQARRRRIAQRSKGQATRELR